MTAKPNKDVLAKVRQWMAYGDEDLKLARYALGMRQDCPYRLVAYHAQQCAEKYLKAFLVYNMQDFPYTHNMSALLELCRKHKGWPEEMIKAEELTPYAITPRYPGEEEVVTLQEAQNAVEIAEYVKQTAGKTLQPFLTK
jgi:HEPN domain-containing protein